MSSRTRRMRSIPSMQRSEGSSVSQFSNRVPETGSRSSTAEPGLVPADYTCTVSPAILVISPAPICDLPPFLTQTNSTDGMRSDSDIRRRA